LYSANNCSLNPTADTDKSTKTRARCFDRLLRPRAKLQTDLDALYVTLRQFDPNIGPKGIGVRNGWKKELRIQRLSQKTVRNKYLASILASF